jgi:hypothetical protein
MRRVSRVDTNQTKIVEALRQVGASVAVTSHVGAGFPDIVVGYRDVNYLFEIKDGSKPPSRRRLTDDEQRWHNLWRGNVSVVNSVDEALREIGAI